MTPPSPTDERSLPLVSVIIPTYNRKDSLLRTLDSLSQQTYPAERFEVIVVDDGGEDDLAAVGQIHSPFNLCCLRQSNQGATVARNLGAAHSQGQYLIFIDDDIALEAPTMQVLVNELTSRRQTIVLGTLRLPEGLLNESQFARLGREHDSKPGKEEQVPFQECMTGLLAVTKQDFLDIGMFQDPTGGWPNWDDVDFGYRASQAGFRFWRSEVAVAWHWDYSVANLSTSCNRWYRASTAAPRLFRTHPGLQGQIPMFHDKGPIQWRHDPPRLIARKLARQAASSRPTMWAMERSVPTLERRAPQSRLLTLFYRWIVSGYIFRGYRDGLRLHQQRMQA